jgi:hypothetical protein
MQLVISRVLSARGRKVLNTVIKGEIGMSERVNTIPAFVVSGVLLVLVNVAVCAAAAQAGQNSKPIRLYPENPHYFLWRGKATVLITSGEHYGAVLNRDFDYKKYLKTLESLGFNMTRTFSGAYCEPVGAFKIANNTLAPAKNRLICPWARSDEQGYANGGNKFDLTKWNPAYFKRLRDFDVASWSNWCFSAPSTKMICGNSAR